MERASGVTMGVILTPEFGRDHRDELPEHPDNDGNGTQYQQAETKFGQMSKFFRGMLSLHICVLNSLFDLLGMRAAEHEHLLHA